jgi:predicted NUDIX family phosphoesterase
LSEQVLVIQNSLLTTHIQSKSGCLITEKKEQIFDNILVNQRFMPRDDAEYNLDHKQVIPYVIIRNGNYYLLLKRLTGQTEKRLHNKYSLGIGGHINPDSSLTGENIVIKGLYKELNEEVSVDDPADLNFIGIINDESNSVSKVHLGLLYELQAKSSGYRVLETGKMTAQWVTEHELREVYDGLETWSQIVYDHYIMKKGGRESRVQGVK